MKQILDYIDKYCLWTAASLFFIIFAISIIEIILRSFFGFSLLWTMDLCVLLASWTILLGAASAIHRKEHLVVDFILIKMSKKNRTTIKLISNIIILIFLFVLIYNGIYVSVLKMDIHYTSLRWPSGYAYIALPVFGIISSLFIIERFINNWKELKEL